MEKGLIIDNRLRGFEKEYFRKNGYLLIEIPTMKNIYYEISSHVDIFAVKCKNIIILEPSLYNHLNSIHNNVINNFNMICGYENVNDKYPQDIRYNVCFLGNYAIHNFKYTDKKILEYIDKNNLEKININQGYSKCSIAVIDDNSVIVTDKSIASILKKKGIDVLYIEDDLDIKLYDKNNRYSKMRGFIGGALSRVDDKIIIFGDLEKIDQDNKIRKFIASKNIEVIDFKGKDVIDYGGIVII